jgi:hypothetical protein
VGQKAVYLIRTQKVGGYGKLTHDSLPGALRRQLGDGLEAAPLRPSILWFSGNRILIRRNCWVVRVLVLCLDGNQRRIRAAKVKKFLQRRKRKGHMGSCSGTWKLVVPWVRLEIGFYSLFFLSEGRDFGME